eukprot:4762001-Pyramimonas_sp.AAC.1
MPAGRCALCSSVKYKNQYALGQWSRDDGLRVCKLCLERKKSIGTPRQCMECFLWKEGPGCIPRIPAPLEAHVTALRGLSREAKVPRMQGAEVRGCVRGFAVGEGRERPM